ncbi:hypothetical protein TELCIR_20367 [Teladorsagia circumcincta]|uniref:Uncharacterized protein n=1 Tax=Teladorsagia circumcincta TaxID=45464 RepID=A0A2G9TJP1_TELCI|nr:hypothetical protein TELCIR_20367 [Teladorsagia circumcincta]
MSAEHASFPANVSATDAMDLRPQNITTPSVAAPEFEDRNEQDEGGKGEEVSRH